MVLGYHVVWGAHGFWLPNDPRGSWSKYVGSRELRQFGRAKKVMTRRSVAHVEHDAKRRLAAKEMLEYPAVTFTGVQARAVGRGFAHYIERSGITVWACSVMPDHVHLVVARHHYDIEQTANLLKGDASRQLMAEGLHPFAERRRENERLPSCWARGQWAVFLNTEEDIHRAIRYVEENPIKAGLPPQRWMFVTPSLV